MKVTSAIVFLATLAPAHAYLQQMTPSVKKSFAPGQGIKHAPVAGNGMGGFSPGSLAPPPPPEAPVEIVANAAQAAPTAFVKPSSYAPGAGKKHAASSGSGMGGFAPGAAAPATPPPAAPAAAAPAAAQAAPASAFVKPSSWAPGAGKKHAASSGSGMGGFTPGAAAPIDGMAPIGIAAPNSADYMAQMGGGFATVKKSSYGPKSHFAPSGGTAGAAAEAAHPDGDYMGQMGGGSAPVKEATYGLGNGKIYSSTGGTGIGYSHLESFGVPTSSYEQKATFVPTSAGEPNSNNVVLDAISQMNNDMVTHQQATIEVLKDISAGVKQLVSKTDASSSWQ
jgi:hypothetical protein